MSGSSSPNLWKKSGTDLTTKDSIKVVLPMGLEVNANLAVGTGITADSIAIVHTNSPDVLTISSPDKVAGSVVGTQLTIQAGGGYDDVGGALVLKSGITQSTGAYLNASDVYLAHGYANLNGTNRDGRVYISSLAGVTQPSIQIWTGGTSGMIAGYHDYDGTENNLTVMSGPGYPSSNNSGKNLYLFAGEGDGSGTDGSIFFGSIARTSISAYQEWLGPIMSFNQSNRLVSLTQYNYANSDGTSFNLLSGIGSDSGATNRQGGNIGFYAGIGANAGDIGKIVFGQHDGSTPTELMAFSLDASGNNGPEAILVGAIPTTNRSGYGVGIAAMSGYDSGTDPQEGGMLLLGCGAGINGGDDGVIIQAHQIGQNGTPISGLQFDWKGGSDNILGIKPASQGTFSGSPANADGYNVMLAGGDGEDAGSSTGGKGGGLMIVGGEAKGSGDNDGGSIMIAGGKSTNAGVKGTVMIDNLGKVLNHVTIIDQTKLNFTPALLIGGTGATSNYLLWTTVTDGSFTISIDGTSRNITGLDFSGALSMADVAAIIQSGIQSVTGSNEQVNWITDHFGITSYDRTYLSAMTVASATGSGTDISGAGALNYLDADTGNGTVVPKSNGVYSLQKYDNIISVDYTAIDVVYVTLPTAQVESGRTIVIKDSGGNCNAKHITIDTQAELIDGASTAVLSINYSSATLYCDGTNWYRI